MRNKMVLALSLPTWASEMVIQSIIEKLKSTWLELPSQFQ